MIPGDLLSAFPHRQFHTIPGLLDSQAALPNSYPNTLRAIQGGSLYHFYNGLWYDPAERRTHDLPCERRTRYRLSKPDTVQLETMVLKAASWYCSLTEIPNHSQYPWSPTRSTTPYNPSKPNCCCYLFFI